MPDRKTMDLGSGFKLWDLTHYSTGRDW